jgi:small GTP-binding protein
MATLSKKICLVGDFSVGKTSLIRRFVDRQFSDRYLSTIGVKISKKLVNFDRDRADQTPSLQLMIWDIEGRTDYKPIDASYLRGASGAIVVADSSRPETIANLERHLNMFYSVNQVGSVAIAFNKSDLVDPTTLQKLISLNSFNREHRVVGQYATSAKLDLNVDRIFLDLSNSILDEQVLKPSHL